MISYEEDGSLLQELFTRDGVGTQLSMEHSETIRLATVSDIPALLELIRPLEQQGILVKRSREQLEMEISQYTIIDRDGVIIACAALNCYADEKMAEMACVAVHPDYRNSSRGDILLEAIQNGLNNWELKSCLFSQRVQYIGSKKEVFNSQRSQIYQTKNVNIIIINVVPKS